jgi:hypothetical protein
MDLPDIPGFLSDHLLTTKGYQGWWKSKFSDIEIESSGKGYRVIYDYGHPFKGAYYDTLEEAVYHVRYRAITNFLGDEY